MNEMLFMNSMFATVVLFILFLHEASTTGDYTSCMSSSYKYTGYDWCFNTQRNLSVASGWLRWDQGPDYLCHPYGRMLVTPNKLQSQAAKTYMTGSLGAQGVYALWVGLLQLDDQSSPTVGWNWRIIHPEGYETRYPVVMTEILWDASASEPNDWNNTGSETNWQNYGMMYNNKGFWDTGHDGSFNVQTNQGAICQYTIPRTVFHRYGNVRVNDTRFIVQQFTPPVPSTAGNICSITCRQTGFCLSFSFNSATNDCQINAIDPAKPAYASKFTVDNNYVAYNRGTN